ncbi:MAG: hypothetical protein QNJ18_17025 [Xenococcaceae cyanobacterium MO_167.B52]|nr:hypothetical protein [Xenococcaceae cyanobacterium MO_167.B52]
MTIDREKSRKIIKMRLAKSLPCLGFRKIQAPPETIYSLKAFPHKG